jgi:hypothetical protein
MVTQTELGILQVSRASRAKAHHGREGDRQGSYQEAIAKGYYVSIFNGADEETPITRGQSLNWLVNFLHQCDDDLLVIRGVEPGKNGKGYRVGTVTLIYGNSGWDVISDFSWVYSKERNTEQVMREITAPGDKLAEKWEKKLA